VRYLSVICGIFLAIASVGCRESEPSIGIANVDCSGFWYGGNLKIGKMADSFGPNGVSFGVFSVRPGDSIGLELTDYWSRKKLSYRGKVPSYDQSLRPTTFEVCLRRDNVVDLTWKNRNQSPATDKNDEITKSFFTIPLLVRVFSNDPYFFVVARQQTLNYNPVATDSRQRIDDYLCGYICVEKDASDVMLGIMSTNQGPFRGQMVRLPIDKIMASGVVPDGGIFLDIDAEWKNVKMHRIDQCPDDTLAAGKQMKQGTLKPGELLLELPLQPATPYTGPTNLTLPDLRFDDEKKNAEANKKEAK
jgi:hypothetical protein